MVILTSFYPLFGTLLLVLNLFSHTFVINTQADPVIKSFLFKVIARASNI